MYTLFSILVGVACLLLIANLVRLYGCTVRSWKEFNTPLERFKAVTLFLIYFIITSSFIYCATAATICNVYELNL